MLEELLEKTGLTIPELATRINPGTKETPNATRIRLERWRDNHPPKLPIVERDLAILGYRLAIVPLTFEDKELNWLREEYQRWIAKARGAGPTITRAAEATALAVLVEIRLILASQLREPDYEELRWWRSVGRLGNKEWWEAYLREQARIAQGGGVESWTAIGNARYAQCVIKGLDVPALS